MDATTVDFEKAFLERYGNEPPHHEERLVEEQLKLRDVPVVYFHEKEIKRRTLPLNERSFVMGSVPTMHGAMKQLGIPIPEPEDYPDSLQRFLNRRVWKSTLRELEERLLEGAAKPVFAKPAGRLKNFTGRVFTDAYDLRWVANASKRQPVWCSEVVPWIAEYRVYVIRGRIVSVDLYDGDLRDRLMMSVVEEAVEFYCQSGKAPCAFGIDFGVFKTGETALVESNEGYSLGAYNISGEDYTDLLIARWSELLTTRIVKSSSGGAPMA